jgi:hypothetical protein
VNTYCIGQAASMGAVLLCGGAKGKRYALPNSNIMIHQLLGGAEGPASDVEIRVRYMLKLNTASTHHRQACGRPSAVEKAPTATTSCRPKRPRLRLDEVAFRANKFQACRRNQRTPMQLSAQP